MSDRTIFQVNDTKFIAVVCKHCGAQANEADCLKALRLLLPHLPPCVACGKNFRISSMEVMHRVTPRGSKEWTSGLTAIEDILILDGPGGLSLRVHGRCLANAFPNARDELELEWEERRKRPLARDLMLTADWWSVPPLNTEHEGHRMSYVGEHQLRVAADGGMRLPEAWISGKKETYYAMDPRGDLKACIRVYSGRCLSKLRKNSAGRLTIPAATPVEVDADGTVSIPKELLRYSGIQNVAVAVGLLEAYELWNPKAWALERAELDQDDDDITART